MVFDAEPLFSIGDRIISRPGFIKSQGTVIDIYREDPIHVTGIMVPHIYTPTEYLIQWDESGVSIMNRMSADNIYDLCPWERRSRKLSELLDGI